MWQPIPLSDLKALIAQQIFECSSETRALYEASAITPSRWALSPWADEGAGFWAVAVFGNAVLWYNDIEEGFNTSSFTESGAIQQYWCNQDTLHQALLNLSLTLPRRGTSRAIN